MTHCQCTISNMTKHSVEVGFIIAPHNIKSEAILALQKSINKKTILYSAKADKILSEYSVFIIDTIGILTQDLCSCRRCLCWWRFKNGFA